jgi:large subunit ribosomal protein L7/L12
MLKNFKNLTKIKFFNILPKFNFADSSKAIKKLEFETLEEQENRFEEELFYLNREWNRLQKDKRERFQDYPTQFLTGHQKREVDIILNEFNKLNSTEAKYFWDCVQDYTKKTIGISKDKPNVFNKKSIPQIDTNADTNNPNFESTQQILSYLAPFLASGYFSGGAGPQVNASAEPVKAEEKKQPEAPKEKAAYNIKLVSFDAAKKITLIKEIRGMLSLGLKEAKELVEKAPVEIRKDVKKAEADEIKKKLTENGGVIELV